MKIVSVTATTHNVPVEIPHRGREWDSAVCVRIETDAGERGVGFGGGGRVNRFALREIIVRDLAPLLVGQHPLRVARIWQEIVRKLGQKNVVGLVANAVSAVDIALWDLNGHVLGQPIHVLLGGHSRRLRVYATLGNFRYGVAEVVEAARARVAEGHTALKLAVGRDRPALLGDDQARIEAVRAVVGPDVEIMVDANQQLDFHEALELARRIEPCHVRWFEEPLKHNDSRQMAALRARCGIPLAAGQNQALVWRFREQIASGSLDVVQTDLFNVGGFTEGVKVAHLAEAFDLPVTSHGWPHINMHLVAGVSNGWLLEMHAKATQASEAVFIDAPKPEGGVLTLGDAPGLGLAINDDALAEYADS